MSFPVDLVNLILYCAQQLGIMLGVGAESVILIFYFLAMRDGHVDAREEEFGRTVHRVLIWGLWFIVSSGVLITFVHFFLGQAEILSAPAFLFKWILVAVVLGFEIARHKRAFVHFAWEGLACATWYALFILHILAPVTTWGDLLVFYTVWTAAFVACFVAAIYMTRPPMPHIEKELKEVKPVAPPPPIPKPAPKPEPKKFVPPPPKPNPPPPPPKAAPLPVVSLSHSPAVVPPAAVILPAVVAKPPPRPVPHKPAQVAPPLPHKPQDQILIPTKPGTTEEHTKHQGLPAIRVMPKTVEDMNRQDRASAVQLNQE